MADTERAEKQYHAVPSIDFQSVLTALDIEFLTVSEQRVLLIYARSVLNINVRDEDIQNASRFEITVLDHDPSGGTNKPHDLITRVIEQIGETAATDLSPVN